MTSAEKLKKLLRMYFSKRAVIFGATGLINALTMIPILALIGCFLPHLFALLIVIQLSIFTDFLWKNYIVFRKVKAKRSKWHFEWTALTGVLVQDLVSKIFIGRIEYIVLYILAVFLGFLVRYGLTRAVIWTDEG